jgi:hypothetical protein
MRLSDRGSHIENHGLDIEDYNPLVIGEPFLYDFLIQGYCIFQVEN